MTLEDKVDALGAHAMTYTDPDRLAEIRERLHCGGYDADTRELGDIAYLLHHIDQAHTMTHADLKPDQADSHCSTPTINSRRNDGDWRLSQIRQGPMFIEVTWISRTPNPVDIPVITDSAGHVYTLVKRSRHTFTWRVEVP